MNEQNLPEPLDTPEFAAIWQLWKKYRVEIRKRITPTTERMQLKRLAAWGAKKAIFAIERSIENGWIGLFEPPPSGLPENSPVSAIVSRQDRNLDPEPLQETEEFTAEQKIENLRKLRDLTRKIAREKQL